MSYQRERDAFLATMGRLGVLTDDARLLLRHAKTLQRYAEAQCNGDWPFDNGERKTKPCQRCQGGCVPSQLKKGGLCPDCRLSDRVLEIVKPLPFEAVLAGDPRGWVLHLVTPDGREIGVPS